MSIDTDTDVDTAPRGRSRSESFVERFRGPLFAAFLFVGMTVFAIGVALGVLAVALDTTPPAPYLALSAVWPFRLIALSVLIGGVILVRGAFRVVGW
jgi:uncharacterized integral membrane protein